MTEMTHANLSATSGTMMQMLQESIELAKKMKLELTAQLLSMAVIEFKLEMHDISQEEIDALCALIEDRCRPD
jgi:hypothetical protein